MSVTADVGASRAVAIADSYLRKVDALIRGQEARAVIYEAIPYEGIEVDKLRSELRLPYLELASHLQELVNEGKIRVEESTTAADMAYRARSSYRSLAMAPQRRNGYASHAAPGNG